MTLTPNNKKFQSAYKKFKSQKTPLAKNIFLNDLYQQDNNFALDFMRGHITETLPIIYTPIVAEAVKHFRATLRPKQSLYLSYRDQKNLAKILAQHKKKPVKIIVVTDGERILGIGDQGASGVEISAAKLMLYSLFANIAPENTLPIILDVGTNNQELLNNPKYFGRHENRLRGKKYDAFIAAFVKAVKKTWPSVLLQWEDFGKDNAARILKKYRDKICSFNDDIQGTAVITLSAIFSALKITKEKLSKQRIVIFGAGSSGVGIANLISAAMRQEEDVPFQKARKQFWMLNSKGLITTASPNISAEQKPFLRAVAEVAAWPKKPDGNIDLLNVVKKVKPTILIGCSSVGGTFTAEIIKEMAAHTARPIILPLSNPTANCEAKPKDLINWTKGRALVATGSPFEPVKYGKKKIVIAQCNNCFAFPGIGLGVMQRKLKKITDEVFYRAAREIYKNSPAFKEGKEILLPEVTEAGKIATKIAKK